MTVTDNGAILPEAVRQRFEEDGFVVVRRLFGREEIARLCAAFAALHAAGPVPGHFDPARRTPTRCAGTR